MTEIENCIKCQCCSFLLLSPYDSMIDDGYFLLLKYIKRKTNMSITVWVLQQNIHFLQPSRLPPRRRRAFGIQPPPLPKHSPPSETFSRPVAPQPGRSISGAVGCRANHSAEWSRLRESTEQAVNYTLKPGDAVRAAAAAALDMALNLACLINCSAAEVIDINIHLRERQRSLITADRRARMDICAVSLLL